MSANGEGEDGRGKWSRQAKEDLVEGGRQGGEEGRFGQHHLQWDVGREHTWRLWHCENADTLQNGVQQHETGPLRC